MSRACGQTCLKSVWRVVLAAAIGVTALLGGCASHTANGNPSAYDPGVAANGDLTDLRKRAQIRIQLAASYFERGQTEVALEEIRQATQIDPSYADAYNLRGLVYLKLNDYKTAEEGFKRALALRPSDPNILHNYGWMLCQQARYPESNAQFGLALANPLYGERAKTYRAQGLCQVQAGLVADAELSLKKSYELEASNPITGYNLSLLLFQRGDLSRAQFYIRRLNNGELANAESLWLGIKIERALGNQDVVQQLAGQLEKRFPQSKEIVAFQRGAFNE